MNKEQMAELMEEIADELLSAAGEKQDEIDNITMEIADIETLVKQLHNGTLDVDTCNKVANDIDWSSTMFDPGRFDELEESWLLQEGVSDE